MNEADRKEYIEALKDLHAAAKDQWQRCAKMLGDMVVERDALKAELAARPVVEPEAARKLREAWSALSRGQQDDETFEGFASTPTPVKAFRNTLRAFCESAPPTSAPASVSDDVRNAARRLVYVLSDEVMRSCPHDSSNFLCAAGYLDGIGKLRDDLASALAASTSAPSESDRVSGSERTRLYGRITELELALGAERQAHAATRLGCERSESDLERELAAATEQRRILTEQLNAQAKSHGEEGERWSREMGAKDAELREAKRELEALKAAPPRVEREVDVKLREVLQSWSDWYDGAAEGANARIELGRAADAWLAAPLSAAPAQDELTKAAVEYIEASFDCPYDERRWNAAWDRCRALYAARRRGEASAARTNVPVAQSEEHAGSNGVVAGSSPAGDTNQASADHLRDAAKKVEPAPAIEESTFDSKAVAFPPAEERRYIVVAPNGSVFSSLYNEQERTHELESGYRWFRVVEDCEQPKPAEERVVECWVREYNDRGCVFGYASAREALQGGPDCRAHRVALPILETVVREGGAQ